jgi:hypothetical protein
MKTLFLFTLLFTFGFLQAQVLQVTTTSISGTAETLANDYLEPAGINGPFIFDQKSCTHGNFTGGLYGNDYASFCFAHAVEQGGFPKHRVSSEIGSRAMINGDNTTSVRIKWKNTGHNYSVTEGHYAKLNSTLDFSVSLAVTGMPAGIPVTVYWWYTIFGGGNTVHENVDEDYLDVANSMSVNGVSQLNNSFNFASPGGLAGWNEWKNKTGTFRTISGANFSFRVSSAISLYLRMPGGPGGFGYDIDKNNGIFKGEIVFTVVPQYPPLANNVADSSSLFLFSLDIGSDSELSDPLQNGNEAFDPGDMYPRVLSPIPMPVPYKNDSLIFAHDPDPKPYFPFNPAPVGTGLTISDVRSFFFDLDGSDLLATSLVGLLYGPGQPSILWFSDSCIYEAEYLFLSFDDDTPELYTSVTPPSVPVTSSSAIMNAIYSEGTGKDEVMEYDLDPIPGASSYFENELFSEPMLHVNLSPSPFGGNLADDDVDALDIIPMSGNYTPCSQWYFTADHEAAYNHPNFGAPYLDPGAIYQVTPTGPVQVVTIFHTGLTYGTDMRDFEFAWVWDTLPVLPRYGLAVLFTVAPDDTLTVEDETGGLDPQMIYYSFLNGTSQPFSAHQFKDPIDGLTVWKNSLNGTPSLPVPVWGTKTWIGTENNRWTNALNWFPQGIPFDPEDVTIPEVQAGIPYPVIMIDGFDCDDLFISKNATLTIKAGNTFTTGGTVTLEGP